MASPDVKACATASVSNLTNAWRNVTMAMAGKDLFYKASAHLFGNVQKTGADAGKFIKKASGQGATPIGMFMASGHGTIGSKALHGYHGGFEAKDIVAVAREKNNAKNSYRSAVNKIGPPRCWFTRNASIYLLGCNTGHAAARDWANKVARIGAHVYGAAGALWGGRHWWWGYYIRQRKPSRKLTTQAQVRSGLSWKVHAGTQ